MTTLELIRISTGTIVRPKGAAGTCGWSPKAWQCAYVSVRDTPVIAFLRANPNWKASEIQE
jgi:hypothetical protein